MRLHDRAALLLLFIVCSVVNLAHCSVGKVFVYNETKLRPMSFPEHIRVIQFAEHVDRESAIFDRVYVSLGQLSGGMRLNRGGSRWKTDAAEYWRAIGILDVRQGKWVVHRQRSPVDLGRYFCSGTLPRISDCDLRLERRALSNSETGVPGSQPCPLVLMRVINSGLQSLTGVLPTSLRRSIRAFSLKIYS